MSSARPRVLQCAPMRLRWFGCCLVFTLLSACGGDDAASEPPVDPASHLLDLSDDETSRVCGGLSERFDDLVSPSDYLDASCTQQAWPVSFDFSNFTGELMGSPMRCKQLVAMCLEKGGALGDFTPTKSLGDDLVDLTRCNLPPPGLELDACHATVGDLEACVAAAAGELDKRLARADCDALGEQATLESASPQVDIAQLPECQGLLERCPIFTLDTLPDGRSPSERE
jgi:hypothetical protein